MIDCIHSQITMMKLLLLAMIFVGFEIQDNLATSEMTYLKIGKDCWDTNKCLLDKHCGQNGKCLGTGGMPAFDFDDDTLVPG